MSNPAIYDAWYQSARGSWIGQQEFSTLLKLFTPKEGQSLLDVGCGTGYFSQRFQQLGLQVTGLDPDSAMIEFAKKKESQIKYIEGDALALPFADNSYDYCSAITSLCFVSEPERALAEMWRVSRKVVIVGLLNRNSLLYYMKRNSSGYEGARWDKMKNVSQWVNKLRPAATSNIRSAIWLPSGGKISRIIEKIAPAHYPYAGFLAVVLEK
jgi:ubiquinone/menaquinone biosynthesis C-methylase UbiE